MKRKFSIMRGVAPLIALASLALLAACGPPPGASVTPAPVPVVYTLYVAEAGLNQVVALNLKTGAAIATIPVGKSPEKLSYDGVRYLWAANSGSGTVSKIDTTTNTVVSTVTVGSRPVSLVAQYGRNVYVANEGSNSISVIYPQTNAVITTVATGGTPFQVADSNSYIAIAETNKTVEFLDASNRGLNGKMTMATAVQGVLAGGGSGQTAILTADGILHTYHTGTSGAPPWTAYDTANLPDASGPVSDNAWGYWLVSGQTTGKLQIIDSTMSAPNTASSLSTYTVGKAPEFAAYSLMTGSAYVPNAGSDSISVVALALGGKGTVTTWQLPSGAMPNDVTIVVPSSTPAPSPTPAPTATPTIAPTAAPTIAPTATPMPATHLYVANGSGGNVLEYTAPFSSSSAPNVNVKIGGNVWGVASDSKYVAVEDSTGYIYIFNAPLTSGSSPVAQFQQFQGGVGGAQLLFDSNGNLYTGTQGSMVFEYSPPFSNASTPAKTINGDNSSFSLATDYLGNLYVGNLGVNQIDVFASPYTSAPTSVTAPGTYGLASYATYLFDADAMNGAVDVYSLPMNASSTPAYTIANTDPHALAVDATGTLYVGDQHGGSGTGSVDAYAQPLSASSRAAYSITSGLVEPVELWFGP